MKVSGGALLVAVCLTTCFAGSLGILAQSPAAAASAPAVTSAVATAPLQSSNGAVPGQPTAPTPPTAKKLALLPAPFPPGLIQGIDAKNQSAAILIHLGEVVRYYRMALAPIQKVGEQSDTLYAQQSQAEATQIGQLAFQAARSQAGFLTRLPTAAAAAATEPAPAEADKAAGTLRNVTKKILDLQNQDAALEAQLATARPAQRGPLEDQKGDVEGQLKLSNAVLTALKKVVAVTATGQGLDGSIDQLQHSVPELVDSKYRPVANSLDSSGSLRDEGITTQATVLFQLLGTEHAIDERVQQLQILHDQADALRKPLIKVLTGTIAASQAIQSDTGSSPSELAAKRRNYDDLTDAFSTLSDVAVPLSQEVLLLEQAQGMLGTWRASVSSERKTILHALLLRAFGVAVVLGLIFLLGVIWRRAATKYVQDVRRRRQILLMRRLVIGFLSGIVLILGFVTQFNSLATFAGFITAGIAVGLQTILLSVAAYFFIVGRYGVKVGDRITVAGVTGEVVDVGLVRFYLLELTGTGTELHSTGRIAVFANSVLFQTGTPLYKQIPGTGFAWHELTIKFKQDSDYQAALETVRTIVATVYATYQQAIEKQHRDVESWMDTAIKAPSIEARLQLVDGAQYAVLYPVPISEAAEVDEKIVDQLLREIKKKGPFAEALEGTPSVRAVVKS